MIIIHPKIVREISSASIAGIFFPVRNSIAAPPPSPTPSTDQVSQIPPTPQFKDFYSISRSSRRRPSDFPSPGLSRPGVDRLLFRMVPI